MHSAPMHLKSRAIMAIILAFTQEFENVFLIINLAVLRKGVRVGHQTIEELYSQGLHKFWRIKMTRGTLCLLKYVSDSLACLHTEAKSLLTHSNYPLFGLVVFYASVLAPIASGENGNC